MARLNTRPSYHPSNTASPRYTSVTPARSTTSDQENQDPSAVRMDKGKGKGRASDAPSSRSNLPTPLSGSSSDARGQKRKRVSMPARPQDHGIGDGGDDDDPEDEDAIEARFNRYFNPNQDPEERRQVKKKSRALARGFVGM